MSVDLNMVGQISGPVRRSWDSKDAMLYALGVGAGVCDPLEGLAFTTENSTGYEQTVLPTYGVLITQSQEPLKLGDYPAGRTLRAGQKVTVHEPLPVSGTVLCTQRITGIYDKKSGALATVETVAVDEASGRKLVTTDGSLFIRGEGGFGGPAAPSDQWAQPDARPDLVFTSPTLPGQPLIYRLSGDRSPLHSDPAFARRAGFEAPIMHGLCTFGFAGRMIVESLCGSDVRRFRSLEGRFSKPVTPGDTLTLSAWKTADGALFRLATSDGSIAIDRGRFTLT